MSCGALRSELCAIYAAKAADEGKIPATALTLNRLASLSTHRREVARTVEFFDLHATFLTSCFRKLRVNVKTACFVMRVRSKMDAPYLSRALRTWTEKVLECKEGILKFQPR